MKRLLFVTAIFSLTAYSMAAQQVKAILVQLNTEQNRVHYFQKNGSSEDAERVINEASGMRKIMIADFNDNFKYCPVYYFMDTNIDQVIKREFKDILLNADDSIVKEPVIKTTDTGYLIVFFGFPDQAKTIRGTKGLVVNDHKFRQLYFYNKPEPQGRLSKYDYRSNKYDIIYSPSAKGFDTAIRDIYPE